MLSKLVSMVTCGLSTFLTFRGLLTSVSFLMLCQLVAVTEGLPTLLTPVGLKPRVNALVLDEARAIDEGLSALLAFGKV